MEILDQCNLRSHAKNPDTARRSADRHWNIVARPSGCLQAAASRPSRCPALEALKFSTIATIIFICWSDFAKRRDGLSGSPWGRSPTCRGAAGVKLGRSGTVGNLPHKLSHIPRPKDVKD
jgi:hypothetical protein